VSSENQILADLRRRERAADQNQSPQTGGWATDNGMAIASMPREGALTTEDVSRLLEQRFQQGRSLGAEETRLDLSRMQAVALERERERVRRDSTARALDVACEALIDAMRPGRGRGSLQQRLGALVDELTEATAKVSRV
jgi:hypothetical protein